MEEFINFQQVLFGDFAEYQQKESFISNACKSLGNKIVIQNLVIATILRPSLRDTLIKLLKTFDNETLVPEILKFKDNNLFLAALQNNILTPQQVFDVKVLDHRYFIPEYLSANFSNDFIQELAKGQDLEEIKQQRMVQFGGKVAYAIFNDDVQTLDQLLQSDSELSKPNATIHISNILSYFRCDNIPLLSYAAFCNSFECFKYLFRKGNNPSVEATRTFKNQKNGMTAAHFAVASNSLQILKFLEENGFDNTIAAPTAALYHYQSLLENFLSNFKDKRSKNRIILECYNSAITFNNVVGIKYLYETFHIDVNSEDLKDDSTPPLSLAAIGGYLHLCQFFVENGATVSKPADNPQKNTPFHFAVFYHNFDVAQYLLSKGARVNEGEYGSALGYSIVQKRDLVAFNWLMKNNANPNLPVYKLELDHKVAINPIEYARNNKFTEFIEVLSDSQPGTSTTNKPVEDSQPIIVDKATKKTILHVYAETGDIQKAESVLSKVNINAKTTDDITPLFLAAQKGKTEMVRFLLQNGADINIQNKKTKETPLQAAIKGKFSETAILLIEEGADLELRDNSGFGTITGFTALHNAVKNSLFDVIKSLIEHKADINAKCGYQGLLKLTPNKEIVQYLKDNGVK